MGRINWDDLCSNCSVELFNLLYKFQEEKKEMKYHEVRRCAVCGVIAAANKFGDGITCPKTTCLNCKKKGLEFVEVKTAMDVKRIIKREIK
jgi:hypothetical protein